MFSDFIKYFFMKNKELPTNYKPDLSFIDLASAQNGTAEDKLNTFKQYMTLNGDNLAALRDMLSTVLTDTAANEEEKDEARKLLDVTDPNQQMFNFAVARDILDFVPVEHSNIPLLDRGTTTQASLNKIFYDFPEKVIAADGKNILLRNPQFLFTEDGI